MAKHVRRTHSTARHDLLLSTCDAFARVVLAEVGKIGRMRSYSHVTRSAKDASIRVYTAEWNGTDRDPRLRLSHAITEVAVSDTQEMIERSLRVRPRRCKPFRSITNSR